LTDPLRIYRGGTGFALQFFPFGLALGSYSAAVLLLFSAEARTARLARSRQRDAAAGLVKMVCPSCGGHIEFPSHALGQKIGCPHCAKTITLLQPV
jgi:hypothetical protein